MRLLAHARGLVPAFRLRRKSGLEDRLLARAALFETVTLRSYRAATARERSDFQPGGQLWRVLQLPRLICALAMAVSLAAAPAPVTWKLSDAPAKSVKAGGRFTVKLTATIQQGWHIYSMKPVEDGPQPTRIWLAEGQPFQLAGAVKGDDPQTMQDPTLHMDIEQYEGSAAFSLPVKVAAGASPGEQKLVVSTQAQSCNNSLCLPPVTVKVEIPVTIAK